MTGVGLYHAGLARMIINRSARTRVVLYHAVENIEDSYIKGLGSSVSLDTFAMHLDYYQRYYTVKRMPDYIRQTHAEEPQMLITFDDGYLSVMENALPLLEERKQSATVYLLGKALRGGMIWVNRLNQALNDYPSQTREVLNALYSGLAQQSRRAIIHHIQTRFSPCQIKQLIDQIEQSVPELTQNDVKLFCSPDDVRQMQSRGISFGFHSNDHWNLGRCKDSELEATLSTSGLEDLINVNTFAYPFGYFAPSSIGRLKRMGFENVMTVGNNNERFCDLHVNRVEVFELSHATLFSRLEVEEPVLAALRKAFHRLKDITFRKTTEHLTR